MSKVFGHFARAEKWMSRDRKFQNGGSFVFASTRICCKRCRFIFKVGQVRALEAVYLGKDVLTALPTGYSTSLIFQLILVNSCKLHFFFSSWIKIVHWKVQWMTSHSESMARKGIESVVLRCGKLLKGQVDGESSEWLGRFGYFGCIQKIFYPANRGLLKYERPLLAG